MEDLNCISLIGTPGEVGRRYGKATADAIREKFGYFYDSAERKGISREYLWERGERLKAVIEGISPAWLEEAEALASTVGAELREILALNTPPEDIWKSDNCTSFMAVGSATLTGESILHKNRDYDISVQSVYLKKLPSSLKYLGSIEVGGNLGVAYFLNDAGLAGASNSGSPIREAKENNVGFNEHLTMRLLAENARSCEDVLNLFQKLYKRGLVAITNNRGSIYLFVDRDRGLVIEATDKMVEHQWVEDAFLVRSNHFLLGKLADSGDESSEHRLAQATQLIKASEGEIIASLFNKVSRDTDNYPKSICNPGTVSAFTSITRKDNTDFLSMAWVSDGYPLHTYYFPLHLSLDSLPDFLVNGKMWQAVNGIHFHSESKTKAISRIEEVERRIEWGVEALEEEIGILLAEGKVEEARKLLEEKEYGVMRAIADKMRELSNRDKRRI